MDYYSLLTDRVCGTCTPNHYHWIQLHKLKQRWSDVHEKLASNRHGAWTQDSSSTSSRKSDLVNHRNNYIYRLHLQLHIIKVGHVYIKHQIPTQLDLTMWLLISSNNKSSELCVCVKFSKKCLHVYVFISYLQGRCKNLDITWHDYCFGQFVARKGGWLI